MGLSGWLTAGMAAVGIFLAAYGEDARETVTAPRPDWGQGELSSGPELLSVEGVRRVEAMKIFYRASVERDPERRMGYLLDALVLDPDAASVMNLFLEEAGRGVPVSDAMKLRLLELAEARPDQERIAVLLLMLERENSGGEYAERRRVLSERLAERLLASCPQHNLAELRRWLPVALLNYGNLSCVLEKRAEAETFYRDLRMRAAGTPVEDIVLEAAALFYSDARRLAGSTREKERLNGEMRDTLAWLRQWDAVPMDAAEAARRAGSYEFLGEVAAAEDLLRRQVALSGNLPPYRLVLARYLQQHLRLDEAASVCGLLAADFPEEPAFASLLADIDLGRGNFAGAVRTLGRLVEAYPDDPNLRFRLAMALYGYGENGAAEQILLSLPQNEWRVVTLRLDIMRSDRRFREAVELAAQFEIMMDRFGGFQDHDAAKGFYGMLARIACDKRDSDLARQCLRRFQRYHLLENADGCNEMGYVLAELGIELDTARQLLEQALRAKPDSPEILDSVAWVYFRQRNWEKARKFIDAAMTVYDRDGPPYQAGVIWEHAGDIYLALKEYSAAEKFWQRALESGDPGVNVKALRDKLERLRSELAGRTPDRNQSME